MIYYDKIIKVIDNFLPQDYVDDIEKLFLKPKEHTTSEIAWFYNDYTASKDKDYLEKIKNISIVYFHGKPKPHQLKNIKLLEHWV